MALNISPIEDAELLEAIEESIVQEMARPTVAEPKSPKPAIQFVPLSAEPSPKEFLAQEAAVAQRQLGVVKNNRARLVERYKANQQREKIMREEMAKLQSDQKALVASIRANDKAAAIQRKAIFDLQEAGR